MQRLGQRFCCREDVLNPSLFIHAARIHADTGQGGASPTAGARSVRSACARRRTSRADETSEDAASPHRVTEGQASRPCRPFVTMGALEILPMTIYVWRSSDDVGHVCRLAPTCGLDRGIHRRNSRNPSADWYVTKNSEVRPWVLSTRIGTPRFAPESNMYETRHHQTQHRAESEASSIQHCKATVLQCPCLLQRPTRLAGASEGLTHKRGTPGRAPVRAEAGPEALTHTQGRGCTPRRGNAGSAEATRRRSPLLNTRRQSMFDAAATSNASSIATCPPWSGPGGTRSYLPV